MDNNATRRRWPLKHKSRNTNKMYRRCRKETKSKRHFIPRRRCYPRYLKGTVILCNVYSLKLKTISVLIRVRNFCIGHPISGQLLFGWCLNESSRYLSASVCANSVRTVICLLRRSCANRKNIHYSAVAVFNRGVTIPSCLPEKWSPSHRAEAPCFGGLEGEKAGLQLGPQLRDPPG